jgi:hypothetical protein
MGVQVMCAGGLPSVFSGIGAGERLLKSGNFFKVTTAIMWVWDER